MGEVAIPTVVCRDCGERISIFAELEHEPKCPGPMRLVFIDDGDPIAEVIDDA